mgnify:CR=1 FL=1
MFKRIFLAAVFSITALSAGAVTIGDVSKIPGTAFSESGFLTSDGFGGFTFLAIPPLFGLPSDASGFGAFLSNGSVSFSPPLDVQSSPGTLTALYDADAFTDPNFDLFLLEITGLFDFFGPVDPLSQPVLIPIDALATFTGVQVSAIPLPAGALLLIGGFGTFAVFRRRKKVAAT